MMVMMVLVTVTGCSTTTGTGRCCRCSGGGAGSGGAGLFKGFVNGFEAEMDELFDAFGGSVAASDAGVFGPRRQTDEAITHFARVAFDGKFGVAGTEDNAAPPTGRGTIFTQSTSTKLATHEGTTTPTHHLGTILTLIHLITRATIKRITPITHPYLMIRLKLMTPMTRIANKRMAIITRHLNSRRRP